MNMTENDGQTTGNPGNRKSDRLRISENSSKVETVSLAEKRALMEKLKDSGLDRAFVFYEESND
ncbi:MAG: hypothetical protein IIB00_01350 [candidate division Zixibacteria bacterium]|nr:hypothetical protein [candidate division Zixibacteria bacterium]